MRAQLTFTYSAALQRNDQSLLHYGFIQLHEPPKLVAQDFPGGNLHDTPKHRDEDYGAWPACMHARQWPAARKGHLAAHGTGACSATSLQQVGEGL